MKEFLENLCIYFLLCCKQAGEERFSITMDEDNKVWYEIVSFSKPAHILSFVGYPYVLLRQKLFAYQSSTAVRKHLSTKKTIFL